jgi:putative transposase
VNESWFVELGEARTKIGSWRIDYNEVQPHSALGNRTPIEYALVVLTRFPEPRRLA